MQGKSWHEDSTFDDDILQHKNTQSMEFLVNNPLVTTMHSRDIYNGVYWTTAALSTAGTISVAGAGVTAIGLKGTGAAISSIGTGGGTWAGVTKAVAVDTIAPGVFRDMQKHGVGMMRQKGILEWTTDHYGGAGELFGPTIANGMNSPQFKKFDSVMTESGLGIAGAKILGFGGRLIWNTGKGLRANLPKGARWAQKNLNNYRADQPLEDNNDDD